MLFRSMHDIVLDYFDNASDALLICQLPKEGSLREFEVKAINKQAKSILAWTKPISAPVPIQEVIPSVVLLHSIDRAYTSGVRQSGTTEPSPLPNRKATFTYEVNRLDNTVLVQLKQKEPAPPFVQKLGEHLLTTSLTCVVVFEAVRDEAGQVEDLRLVFQNEAAEANPFLGIKARPGTFITDWYPGTKQMGQFARYVEVIETGQPFVSEKYYPDRDQTFQVAASRYEDGVIISYYNLTARQKAEQQVQQHASILQQIIDSSQDAIALWKPVLNQTGQIIDFRAVQYNKATLYAGMYTEEDYQKLTLTQISPGARDYIAQYAGVLQTGVPIRIERHNRRGDQELWMDISASRLGDHMLTIFRDITATKRTTQELEALLEELRQSNRSLEQFAYIASHDLYEPTRKINAFGDMLVKQYAHTLPPAGLDLVRRMQSSSVRMQDLIDGLLMYSRFSTQKEAHEVVPLNTILNNILLDLEATIEEKKAEVVIGTLPRIRGNAVQLRQLFQNLIANALKFTDQSTTPRVVIEAGPATTREIQEAVSLSANRNWCAIRVRDNGIGFDEEHRNKVFELFARLHGRSQYPGSGLGLAICKKVAEQHGGGITVSSSPGQGSTFVVVLPALTREAHAG